MEPLANFILAFIFYKKKKKTNFNSNAAPPPFAAPLATAYFANLLFRHCMQIS
jgi:hypothetical protein